MKLSDREVGGCGKGGVGESRGKQWRCSKV